MSRKFLTHIDLQGNQLYNALIGNATSSSGLSTTDGSIYFDTTLHKLQVRENGAWVGFYTTTTTLNNITAPTGSLAMNSQKITGLADPTSAQDAATKIYVDNAVVGIDWKPSVLLASTTNVSLSSNTVPLTLDGTAVSTGNRILIKDQTDQTTNGIYVVGYSAPNYTYTRATDADTGTEVTGGLAVFVESGSTQADTGWVLTAPNGSTTIGTDNLVFTQFTGLGQVTAGAGLTKSGNTLDVGAGTGITVNANDVAVNYSALWIGSSNVQNATGTQALTGISSITGGTTLSLLAASSTGTTGNNLTIAAGNTTNTGIASAGDVSITGGNQTAGTNVDASGGFVLIAGGTSTAGSGGDVTIRGGASAGGNGGVIIGATNTFSVSIGASGTPVNLPGVGTSGFVKLGAGGALSADTNTYLTSSTGVTTVNGNSGAITGVAFKASGTIALTAGVAGTITHNLGSRAVVVQMYESSSSLPTNLVDMDVTSATTNTVTVTASASATYYYVVIG